MSGFYKKTIILSNFESSQGVKSIVGMAKIEKNNRFTSLSVTLNEIKVIGSGEYFICVKSGDFIQKTSLGTGELSKGMFSLSNSLNLDNDILCVLLKVQNSVVSVIAAGSVGGIGGINSVVDFINNSVKKQVKNEEIDDDFHKNRFEEEKTVNIVPEKEIETVQPTNNLNHTNNEINLNPTYESLDNSLEKIPVDAIFENIPAIQETSNNDFENAVESETVVKESEKIKQEEFKEINEQNELNTEKNELIAEELESDEPKQNFKNKNEEETETEVLNTNSQVDDHEFESEVLEKFSQIKQMINDEQKLNSLFDEFINRVAKEANVCEKDSTDMMDQNENLEEDQEELIFLKKPPFIDDVKKSIEAEEELKYLDEVVVTENYYERAESYLDEKERLLFQSFKGRDVDISSLTSQTENILGKTFFTKPSSDVTKSIEDYDENDELLYFKQVERQLDSLFQTYDSEENLSRAIDQSKWAKIDFNNDGKYYVVGIIYNGTKPMCICYGVPDVQNSITPKELLGYAEWLPLEMEGNFKGYWMMYQNCKDGECVTGEIIK